MFPWKVVKSQFASTHKFKTPSFHPNLREALNPPYDGIENMRNCADRREKRLFNFGWGTSRGLNAAAIPPYSVSSTHSSKRQGNIVPVDEYGGGRKKIYRKAMKDSQCMVYNFGNDIALRPDPRPVAFSVSTGSSLSLSGSLGSPASTRGWGREGC